MTFSDSDVYVAGVGAVTAVGRGVLASAAAIRAGLAGFAAHPYMVDSVGLPMRVAPLPWVDLERSLEDRIGDSLLGAVREVIAPLEAKGPQPSMSLLINLPPVRPGLGVDLISRIGARVSRELPRVFDRVAVASLGHAGTLVGLRSAIHLLEEDPGSVCIVAGADSYLEPDLLEWLEHTEQLHGAGERNNAWGFIPGEGGGAVLLASRAALRQLAIEPLGRVRGVGVGSESELIGSGTVCLGLGLTAAVRHAIEPALRPRECVTDVYCDMNGEPYRADEYAFLVTRTREHFVAPSEFIAPADCWGDVGAASGALLIALACIAGVKGYSKGNTALIWASSVGGERGAVLLETKTGADARH